MITRIDLSLFKCFELLKLPLTELTLLSGANASGKSSLLQALVLLHQTIREHEWSTRLMLNGNTLRLGTVLDVVDKIHGRHIFTIAIEADSHEYRWTFSGDRSEMSMDVVQVEIDGKNMDSFPRLKCLLPETCISDAADMAERLRTMTYITAERIGPCEFYPLEDRQIALVVGPAGEHAVSILHSRREDQVQPGLEIKDTPPTLLRQVEAWMQVFFPGCGLVVEQIPRMNAVTLGLRTSPDTDFHHDNSLHGQFQDIHSFETAIDHLMTMRNKSRQYGRELYCHHNMAHSDVTFDMNMRQALNRFDRSKQRVLMQWLAQQGPFWDDDRVHESDDYLECHEQIVTDTALGEAAIRRLHSRDCRVISLVPSDWEGTPLTVFWKSSDIDETGIDIPNYWEMPPLESALREAPEPVSSWEAMGKICQRRFNDLYFSSDAFDPLNGHPFVFGCAQRIMERLDVLNRFKTCFDETGTRTDEGQWLYQEYFTGKKAWFTDSSESEKNKFKSQLTFKHPDVAGEDLICTWHGKVKTPQIRLHFSWPVSADTPLYIVYVGPKITKK